MIRQIQKLLDKAGISVRRNVKWKDHAFRRAHILKNLNIDLVIDVGANHGQFGEELRTYGYQNHIISFEPIAEAYELLDRKAKQGFKWTAHNIAVGDVRAQQDLHITANSVCTSLLMPGDNTLAKRVNTEVVAVRQVDVLPLDEIEELKSFKQAALKIDAQGYEDRVLKGAAGLLNSNVALVEMEISVIKMYEGQENGLTLLGTMQEKGWVPVSINIECCDLKTMYGLQYDVLFIRKEQVES